MLNMRPATFYCKINDFVNLMNTIEWYTWKQNCEYSITYNNVDIIILSSGLHYRVVSFSARWMKYNLCQTAKPYIPCGNHIRMKCHSYKIHHITHCGGTKCTNVQGNDHVCYFFLTGQVFSPIGMNSPEQMDTYIRWGKSRIHLFEDRKEATLEFRLDGTKINGEKNT